MGSGGKHVGVALATKNTEVGIGRWAPIEGMVGSEKLESFYGMAIEKMGDSVESLHPIGM